jgi:hypothetical protein
VSLLVWNLTLDLSGLGDPASSYATAGIALEIIGARKPHRHDKADTPPGGKPQNPNFNILTTTSKNFSQSELVKCKVR